MNRELLDRFAKCGLIPYRETEYYRRAHEQAELIRKAREEQQAQTK